MTFGSGNVLHSTFFVPNSPSTGYAVGWNGTIKKTTDAGNTWVSQTSGTTQFLNSVFFVSQGSSIAGYAAGTNGKIIKTTIGAGIEDDMAETQLKLYPNPASDFITFTTQDRVPAQLTLNIYTVEGSLIRSETIKENQHDIDIHTLSNGELPGRTQVRIMDGTTKTDY